MNEDNKRVGVTCRDKSHCARVLGGLLARPPLHPRMPQPTLSTPSEPGLALKFPQVQSAQARQGTRLPPTPADQTHSHAMSPREKQHPPDPGAGGWVPVQWEEDRPLLPKRPRAVG